MTAKDFIRAVSNGEEDIIQMLLDIIARAEMPYCIIGGLAVNAYADPVVSLDLDIVVVASHLETLCTKAREAGLQIERFEHRINLSSPKSDLRIQLLTGARYQEFIPRSQRKNVLGYEMMVATMEDVLKGKLWAYTDETRRKSKRQKDLADIARLVETHPDLSAHLPDTVRALVE
ncbi:MAG: hypothetical protein NTV89_03705 [Proteobacteria bacterium]|nr:hypothetical protein [Pseudomonadota bacterium]